MCAYPRGVGTLDARSRSVGSAFIAAALVWVVLSLALPRTDVSSVVRDPAGIRLGPMAALAVVASDRPTTSVGVRRGELPDVIPAVVSAAAGTRSALLWLIGDVRFPVSSITTSRLTTGLVRRGPPLSFRT